MPDATTALRRRIAILRRDLDVIANLSESAPADMASERARLALEDDDELAKIESDYEADKAENEKGRWSEVKGRVLGDVIEERQRARLQHQAEQARRQKLESLEAIAEEIDAIAEARARFGETLKETEEKQNDAEARLIELPPKLALALVPFDAVELVAAVLEAPCTGPNPKYELRDWEQGMSWNYCTSALLRHLVEWFQHRRHLDRSDGLPCIAHVAARALMLTAMELRGVGDDDRPGSSER